jgi:FkbH-like protein
MSHQVKCVVWDLDRTVWDGVLLEGDSCPLRPGVAQTLHALDRRGILQSAASASEPEPALAHLRALGVADYFLCPRIGWDDKTDSLRAIAEELGLALDALAFVDDEPFEREQVRRLLPQVRVYAAGEAAALPSRPELTPGLVTPESARRREMYVQVRAYAAAEQGSSLPRLEFLRQCGAVLVPRPAVSSDLGRILELMQRTHQLNATGVVYGPDEVRGFMTGSDVQVFVASLTDRFLDYGRIALAIVRREPRQWTILASLLSCRVLKRGVGNAFLGWIEARAHRAGAAELRAHFIRRERNRPMYLQYTMAGFMPTGAAQVGMEDGQTAAASSGEAPGGVLLLARPTRAAPPCPDWLHIAEEVPA